VTTTRRRARLAAVVACALGALVLGGCHASATVAIRVRADGRGTVAIAVSLDRAARLALAGAASNPGSSASRNELPDVPLDDLRARGWTVSSWRSSAGGGAALQLSKSFNGGAGLSSVLAELDGNDGALRDAHVVRERALLRDRDGVSLLADLRHLRVGVADDAALAARLRAAGIDVAALDAGLRARITGSFDLTVRVELPDGAHATVHVKPGEQRRLTVASTTDHPGRRAALVAAGLAALLGLALFVIAARHAHRARRARRAHSRA
jgi:hypothetical protein